MSHTVDNLVYALLDPETQEVRYIGKSKHGLERPRQHRRVAHRERSHKACWIRHLARKGQEPAILVLSRHATEDEAYAAEKDYIRLYRALGARLTNHNDGGRGGEGGKPSAETRRKLSEARRGARNHWFGKRMPRHVIDAMQRARPAWTDEQRKARSELLKSKHQDPAYMANKIAKLQKPVVAIRGSEVHWFPSARAAEALGFRASAICNVLKGRKQQHGGFVWAYALPRPT